MSQPNNQEAVFVWTRKGDNIWREENDGILAVTIETFCVDEYYCTPENRAGSGQRGMMQLSGIMQLFQLPRMRYMSIQS